MFSATWFFLTQLWNAAWFSPTYAIQVFLSLLSYLFGIGDDLATQFAIPSYMRILFLAFACISTGYAGLVAVRTALFWPFRRVHDTLAAIVCPKELYSEPRPYGSVEGLPGIEVVRPRLLPCRFPPFGATYGRSGNPNLDAYIVPNREFWLTRLYNRDITYATKLLIIVAVSLFLLLDVIDPNLGLEIKQATGVPIYSEPQIIEGRPCLEWKDRLGHHRVSNQGKITLVSNDTMALPVCLVRPLNSLTMVERSRCTYEDAPGSCVGICAEGGHFLTSRFLAGPVFCPRRVGKVCDCEACGQAPESVTLVADISSTEDNPTVEATEHRRNCDEAHVVHPWKESEDIYAHTYFSECTFSPLSSGGRLLYWPWRRQVAFPPLSMYPKSAVTGSVACLPYLPQLSP